MQHNAFHILTIGNVLHRAWHVQQQFIQFIKIKKKLFKLRIKMGTMTHGYEMMHSSEQKKSLPTFNLQICWCVSDSFNRCFDGEVTGKCATQAAGWQRGGLFGKTEHLCVFTAPSLCMTQCEVNMSDDGGLFSAESAQWSLLPEVAATL